MITIICKSPQELDKKLKQIKSKQRLASEKILCLIDVPSILINTFDYSNDKQAQLSSFIDMNAAELIHVPLHNLSVSFHQEQDIKDSCHGFFACMPKKVMDEFMNIFQQYSITPMAIKPYHWFRLCLSHHAHPDEKPHIVIDQLNDKHRYHISVWVGKRCVLWRIIEAEGINELKKELTNSLMRASSNPQCKNLNICYVHADNATDLKNHFNHLDIKVLDALRDGKPTSNDDTLNFCLAYFPSEKNRQIVYTALLSVCILFGAITLWQGVGLITNFMQQQSLTKYLEVN